MTGSFCCDVGPGATTATLTHLPGCCSAGGHQPKKFVLAHEIEALHSIPDHRDAQTHREIDRYGDKLRNRHSDTGRRDWKGAGGEWNFGRTYSGDSGENSPGIFWGTVAIPTSLILSCCLWAPLMCLSSAFAHFILSLSDSTAFALFIPPPCPSFLWSAATSLRRCAFSLASAILLSRATLPLHTTHTHKYTYTHRQHGTRLVWEIVQGETPIPHVKTAPWSRIPKDSRCLGRHWGEPSGHHGSQPC